MLYNLIILSILSVESIIIAGKLFKYRVLFDNTSIIFSSIDDLKLEYIKDLTYADKDDLIFFNIFSFFSGIRNE